MQFMLLFHLQELRERIKPYFLRRLKSEVFGDDDATRVKLSKKNEIIVWLKLTTCQVFSFPQSLVFILCLLRLEINLEEL